LSLNYCRYLGILFKKDRNIEKGDEIRGQERFRRVLKEDYPELRMGPAMEMERERKPARQLVFSVE